MGYNQPPPQYAPAPQQYAQPAPPQYAPAPQQYAEPAPAPAAASQDDMSAELKRLGDLHASGVLTDEEFAAAKAKVLGI